MASHPMGIAQQPQIAHARVHLAAQRAVTCIVRRASVACRTATPAADAALLNGAQASTSESCCAAPQSASFAARTAAAARRFAARAGPQLRSLLVGPSAIPGIAGAPPAFLAAPLVAATLPGGGFADLFTNRVFMVGFWAWFCAQFGKIFTRAFKTGRWELRAMIDSGGMPSSHSAFCVGVTTAIALQHGLGSSLFALGLCFSLIVMYDAAGVRRHAGKQAEVLNQVINELLDDHPVSDVKLKEVLGHTPRQVLAGAVLGVLVGIFYPMPCNPAAVAV